MKQISISDKFILEFHRQDINGYEIRPLPANLADETSSVGGLEYPLNSVNGKKT